MSEYRIVELPYNSAPEALTPGLKEQLKELPGNPGFAWLTKRLRAQKAAIVGLLESSAGLDAERLYHLTAALHWAGWLDATITHATRPDATSRQAQPDEATLAAFQSISQDLELVGVNK